MSFLLEINLLLFLFKHFVRGSDSKFRETRLGSRSEGAENSESGCFPGALLPDDLCALTHRPQMRAAPDSGPTGAERSDKRQTSSSERNQNWILARSETRWQTKKPSPLRSEASTVTTTSLYHQDAFRYRWKFEHLCRDIKMPQK